LIRLSLLTIVKKYNLPLSQFDVSPDTQGTVEPVSTNLYHLEITNDKHQSFFNITLDYKAIEKLIRAHFKKGVFQSLADELIGSSAARKSKLQNHKWSFLGFVRDTPLTVDAIKKDRDFWREAVLATQKSAHIPLILKKDIPHYALFLVAAENTDKLVIDADVALMISQRDLPGALMNTSGAPVCRVRRKSVSKLSPTDSAQTQAVRVSQGRWEKATSGTVSSLFRMADRILTSSKPFCRKRRRSGSESKGNCAATFTGQRARALQIELS
jgi:hypothetical protein